MNSIKMKVVNALNIENYGKIVDVFPDFPVSEIAPNNRDKVHGNEDSMIVIHPSLRCSSGDRMIRAILKSKLQLI